MRAPMLALSPLFLAAALAIDGEEALRHASQLAALGPHPLGSPRSRFAAEYVAAQFREAGLSEVRFQDVVGKDVRGANVLGVLRGPGPELVVLAAHHDTAQDSPGAYGSSGGVGVLIEAARALAGRGDRPRTIVFASFDGREPVLGSRGGLGARAYVQSLGREARQVVGVLVVDRAGRPGIPTVLETTAYPDPLRSGAVLVAPAFLVRATVEGAKAAGESLAAGDPSWSWLYQAGARTYRLTDAGDERPFLEAGLPALRLSGRRFLAADPHDQKPTDTADKLDKSALAQTGRVVLGGLLALENAARAGGSGEETWFLRFGEVASRGALLGAGALSLLPGLLLAARASRLSLGVRLGHAALFGLLLYLQPVLAVFAFFLWNVVTAFGLRLWRLALGGLPAAMLLALGGVAWSRGAANGVLPALYELVLAVVAAALALASGARPGGRPRSSGGRKGLPKR